MTLYEIVQSLRNASGNIAKQAILDANKDNELLKAYMKAVYDVGINYYQKKAPKPPFHWNLGYFDIEDNLAFMTEELAGRTVTGKRAENALRDTFAASTPEDRELLTYVLDRKIGASVGDTMVLKTWPDLYFLPPYQRCSLLDKKARERFGKLKRFYVQTKADGSFAYVVKRLDGTVDVITRQGSKYPQWFAEEMAQGLEPGKVIVGEILVQECGTFVDRKTANGLLNSALKDGNKWDETMCPKMQAWDMLTQEEFEAGKSDRPYSQRLDDFKISGYFAKATHVELIYTAEVDSLELAFRIYQDHLQLGLEGVIISDPDDLWKDGTSKGKVKLKIKFEVEMRVISVFEGQGKATGMVGGVMIASEDKGIICDCGSGFTDAQRKHFWDHPDELIHKVVMVEANDITQSRDGRKKPALSLPIFCEVRYDKHVADTTERIYAQLEAAKNGS